MAKAKRLSCNHLFHLACLRSWYDMIYVAVELVNAFCMWKLNRVLTLTLQCRLDQGLSENYSCPTCRKPLQMGRPEDESNPRAVDVSTDEQLARQLSSGFDQNNPPGRTLPTGVLPNQMQNPLDGGAWRFVSSSRVVVCMLTVDEFLQQKNISHMLWKFLGSFPVFHCILF